MPSAYNASAGEPWSFVNDIKGVRRRLQNRGMQTMVSRLEEFRKAMTSMENTILHILNLHKFNEYQDNFFDGDSTSQIITYSHLR